VRRGDADLGAVEQAVVVAVGIERVDQAVAVGVVGVVGLGAVEHAVVVAVGVLRVGAQLGLLGVAQPVHVVVGRRRDVVAGDVGVALAGSTTPLRSVSSAPSGTPPSSVSRSSGSVVVAPASPSGMKCPAPTSVSASGVVTPSSVPSYRPSLSLSGSRR
jgi:hypothetical protein